MEGVIQQKRCRQIGSELIALKDLLTRHLQIKLSFANIDILTKALFIVIFISPATLGAPYQRQPWATW